VNAKAGWGLALFALATIGGTAYTLLSTDYNVFVDLFLLSIGTIGIALFVGYKNENTSTSANVYDVVEADKGVERRRAYERDPKSVWRCPNCLAPNFNEDIICYKCKRAKPIPGRTVQW
jgi:hypothetical protein